MTSCGNYRPYGWLPYTSEQDVSDMPVETLQALLAASSPNWMLDPQMQAMLMSAGATPQQIATMIGLVGGPIPVGLMPPLPQIPPVVPLNEMNGINGDESVYPGVNLAGYPGLSQGSFPLLSQIHIRLKRRHDYDRYGKIGSYRTRI